MIIDLPSTTSSQVNRALVDLREKGGTIALGRVMTLVISTDEKSAEDSLSAANAASFEHPCRVLVIRRHAADGPVRMDGQIRVGGDAGASEAILLDLYGELAEHEAAVAVPLLLPDAPVVVWWPGACPEIPAEDPLGQLGQRRITDIGHVADPMTALRERTASYRPGDTDLAWTRVTLWRGLLAAALDQEPRDPVVSAEVSGAANSASTDLLAGWLALRLTCSVIRRSAQDPDSGLHRVVLSRHSGPITLSRPMTSTATLTAPGQPDRHVALPRRSLRDCIAEELRRLDADEVYAEALRLGLPRVHHTEEVV